MFTFGAFGPTNYAISGTGYSDVLYGLLLFNGPEL